MLKPEGRQKDKDRISKLAAQERDQEGRWHYSGLIYDWILRQEALLNAEAVFTLGALENNAFGFIEDSYTIVAENGLHADAAIIEFPEWRDMEKYIKPEVYERAKGKPMALLRKRTKKGFPYMIFLLQTNLRMTVLGISLNWAYRPKSNILMVLELNWPGL